MSRQTVRGVPAVYYLCMSAWLPAGKRVNSWLIMHTVWAVAMIMGGDVACAEIARSSNTELNIRTSIRYDRSLVTLNPMYT